MSQRNFPASFWSPSHTEQSPQQLQTSSNCHSNAVNMFQQNHNATNHYNNTYHNFTSQHSIYEQNTPTSVRARVIPVSFTQFPSGTFKNCTPGLTQQVSSQSCRTLSPSFPQEFSAQCNDTQNSSRFNPRYNALLVQPEVKPNLPVVPGEPRAKQNGKGKDTVEDFPGKLLAKNGEN